MSLSAFIWSVVFLEKRNGNGCNSVRGSFSSKWILKATIVLLISVSAFAQKTASEIIKQSVEVSNRDWDAAPQFDCSERDRDKNGSKTYETTMILGSPYQRLVAENGHALSASKTAEQHKKFEKEMSKRRQESSEERSQRIAKYEAERKRDHTMMQQLTTAFDFKLAGQQKLKGHSVYVLKATPRKGYKPPDRDSEVLTGMQGTLWIDKKTFQWVKVEAHVIHPVTIEGFLAQVEPGTRFELEKSPVAPDVWLPAHFSMKSNAKVLFIASRHSQEDDTYFNYHKAQAANPQK